MGWAELLKKNERKVKKAMRKANWDALCNPHLRFYINMDENGDIWTEEDIAGGNSFSSLVFNGDAIEIVSYCHQFFNGNTPLEQHAYVTEYLDEAFNSVLKEV